MATTYIGRFAPSPTGPLHAGSLVAALASWLDARAHAGAWLVRIEDIDITRCRAIMPSIIMRQLRLHGLVPDVVPLMQSHRGAIYRQALDTLITQNLAYPCICSRRQIVQVLHDQGSLLVRNAELVYPGTCRLKTGQAAGLSNYQQHPHAWRLNIQACLQKWGKSGEAETAWHDRRLGRQQQVVTQAVGDFVLRRSDGLWAYQLAVVVDDAAQKITHIVRGEDLADNTPRQIVLQQALGLPQPQYLHTPLVYGANGEKLSKHNGAAALPQANVQQVLANLNAAARVLDLLPTQASTPQQALAQWVDAWRRRWIN